jgi:hypothetical protein
LLKDRVIAGDHVTNGSSEEVVSNLAHQTTRNAQYVESQSGVRNRAACAQDSRADLHQLPGLKEHPLVMNRRDNIQANVPGRDRYLISGHSRLRFRENRSIALIQSRRAGSRESKRIVESMWQRVKEREGGMSDRQI